MADAGFNLWWGLIGLLPLLLYIVLVLREMDPLPATIICVVVGAVINAKSLIAVGTDLSKAMGSFLGLVGLIIMLGRGLGEVLSETKVAHTLVYKIIYGIGVNTQKKALLPSASSWPAACYCRSSCTNRAVSNHRARQCGTLSALPLSQFFFTKSRYPGEFP